MRDLTPVRRQWSSNNVWAHSPHVFRIFSTTVRTKRSNYCYSVKSHNNYERLIINDSENVRKNGTRTRVRSIRVKSKLMFPNMFENRCALQQNVICYDRTFLSDRKKKKPFSFIITART